MAVKGPSSDESETQDVDGWRDERMAIEKKVERSDRPDGMDIHHQKNDQKGNQPESRPREKRSYNAITSSWAVKLAGDVNEMIRWEQFSDRVLRRRTGQRSS